MRPDRHSGLHQLEDVCLLELAAQHLTGSQLVGANVDRAQVDERAVEIERDSATAQSTSMAGAGTGSHGLSRNGRSDVGAAISQPESRPTPM